MRTVSFSPAEIRRTLNRDFVCYASNTEGEPGSGRSQGHAPSDKAGPCTDGVGNQNVQLLFMTVDGEIFHTVSGFRGPESLKSELAFASTMFDKIREMPGSAKTLVRTMHLVRQSSQASNPRATRSSRSRSRSRSGGGGGGIRRSRQFDYEFASKYPMLSIDKFEKNPRLLVGNGTSVFTSGSSTGGSIGG